MMLSNLQDRFIVGIVTISFLLIGLAQCEKVKLKISTIERVPYVEYHKDYKGNDRFSGFVPDLLDALCKEKAFTCDYEINLVGDGNYGNKYGDAWTGMMGEVLSRQADIALPIMATKQRKVAVDATNSIGENILTVLVNEEWEIENREDLLRSTYDSWLKFGTIKTGWTRRAFTNAEDELGKSMNAKMTVFAKNLDDGIDQTLYGNYSFIDNKDALEYYANKYCDLAIKDEFYPTDPNAIIVRKESGLAEKINQALAKLKESGKFEALRKASWDPELPCSDSGVFLHASIYMSLLLFSFAALLNY